MKMRKRLKIIKGALWSDSTFRMRMLRCILLADVLLFLAAFFLNPVLALLNETNIRISWLKRLVALIEPANSFTSDQRIALFTPAVALMMAWTAHQLDHRLQGKGVRDIVVGGRTPANLETDVIAASMTKQSVLAAIAAVLAVAIQQQVGKSGFTGLVSFLATIAFSATILFLLVSMVCYDYASRFGWRTTHKKELVRKALVLDVYAWYLLLVSFILSLALISTWLSIFTCFLSGILMWWYYFFSGKRSNESLGLRGISKYKLPVKSIATARALYCDGLGLVESETAEKQVCLRVGDWSEIILEANSSPTKQVIGLTLAPADFKFAATTLTEKKINYSAVSETSAAGIQVQLIRVTDPENLHDLEIRSIFPSREI